MSASSTPTPDLTRELRWLADSYDRTQQERARVGERIRAALREGGGGAPDAVLGAIRRGEEDGPAPLLGREYRRHWEQEQELARLLAERLELHPAWPWMRQVRGVGPVLAGMLVSRLDVTRAATPSSFWAYCGLATVPAVRYRCPTCGHTVLLADGATPAARHAAPDGASACPDELRRVQGPDPDARVAQPRASRGQRSAYDRFAKKTCYQIGSALVRTAGEFQRYYRVERQRLEETRRGWDEGRRHLAALRKTEKLFLAQLWIVWREALDLPVTRPHAQAGDEGQGWIDPWQMVATERPHRWVAPPVDPPARRAQA